MVSGIAEKLFSIFTSLELSYMEYLIFAGIIILIVASASDNFDYLSSDILRYYFTA